MNTRHRLTSLVYLLLAVLFLAQRFPLHSQLQTDIRLKIALNNAALYYQQGKPERAYTVLEEIAREFPDQPEVNYRLAILSYRLLGDMVAYEKYYRKALSHQPNLVDPQLLSENDVARIFQVKKLNEEHINLRSVLNRVRFLFERRSFVEARRALLVSVSYLPHVDAEDVSRFHLYLSYCYAQLDSLMQASAQALQVDKRLIGAEDRAFLDSLHQKVYPWLDRFLEQYRTPRAALSFLNQLENQQRYAELLVASQIFSKTLFLYPHSSYWPVQLYRLEALASLNDWQEGLPLYNQLHEQLEQAGLLELYRDQLDQAYASLSLASIQSRIGRTSARADSFLLWGHYDEGMRLYQNMLTNHSDTRDIQAYLYFKMSKIHAAIGRYSRAKDFWNQAKDLGMNQVLLDTLKETINRAEAFEKEWRATQDRVMALLASHRPDGARTLLVPLLKSPYLRFGLRARALFLAARIYRQLGKPAWAHSLIEQASHFPAEQDSLRAADSLMALQRRRHYFVSLPDTTRQLHHRLGLLSAQKGAVELLPIPSGDLYGSHPLPVTITAALGNEVTLRGGSMYRVRLEKHRIWRQLLNMAAFVTASRLYLTFR